MNRFGFDFTRYVGLVTIVLQKKKKTHLSSIEKAHLKIGGKFSNCVQELN